MTRAPQPPTQRPAAPHRQPRPPFGLQTRDESISYSRGFCGRGTSYRDGAAPSGVGSRTRTSSRQRVADGERAGVHELLARPAAAEDADRLEACSGPGLDVQREPPIMTACSGCPVGAENSDFGC